MTVRAAVVHTSGRPLLSARGRAAHRTALRRLGVELDDRGPGDDAAARHGYSVATPRERAAILAAALTDPDIPVVWAAQGGFGATEVLPDLERLLPARLPATTFVGFSDSCAIGATLALCHTGVDFLHATHAFDPHLLTGRRTDAAALIRHLHGVPKVITGTATAGGTGGHGRVAGHVVPLNLSIAACLPAVVELPDGPVLFLEDVDDDLRRLLRALDVLCAAGWLEAAKAVVLGEFAACRDESGATLPLERIARAVAERTATPVLVWPEFGHGRARVPLRLGAPVELVPAGDMCRLTVGV
ncbi:MULTISPECIES: LD-carboxypeptidase [Streptomyces]|uniref:LD-carboxypeptidase n=1 Tax=Streptomyces TaxID=1883 RepID=UPI00292E1FED|nr:LD-carboxypeptidase [Streptomyces sp. NEAU-HV9]